MKELPNIESLAHVEEEKLLKLWEGLGYYTRARNLKKAAIQIMNEYQGMMPNTYLEIIKLPGIGEYTAGAIASIAYNEKTPAIDGNVFRVMMRIQNSRRNISKPLTKKELFQELSEIMPDTPGIFNQALMELGATICIPNGKPLCEICPVQTYCQALKAGTILELPIKDEKRNQTKEEYTVFLLLDYHKIAIHKRPHQGLLASMYEFPNVKKKLEKKEALDYLKKLGYVVLKFKEVEASKHIFTHKIWEMTNYIAYVEEIKDGNEWITIPELLENYALPSAFKKQLEAVKEEVGKR